MRKTMILLLCLTFAVLASGGCALTGSASDSSSSSGARQRVNDPVGEFLSQPKVR